jgi:hypothetical protein
LESDGGIEAGSIKSDVFPASGIRGDPGSGRKIRVGVTGVSRRTEKRGIVAREAPFDDE